MFSRRDFRSLVLAAAAALGTSSLRADLPVTAADAGIATYHDRQAPMVEGNLPAPEISFLAPAVIVLTNDASAADRGPRPEARWNEWKNAFNGFDALYGARYLNPVDLADSAILSWGESYRLRAYSVMYAATGDPAYLTKAQTHIDAIFNAAAQNRDGNGWGWSTSRYSINRILNGGFVSISPDGPVISGQSVSVPEPWQALSSPDICDAARALVEDGIPAGLSYSNGTKSVANSFGTSCIDVDFGSLQTDGGIVVRYWMADTLCGHSCAGAFCSTDPSSSVSASPDAVSWTGVGQLPFAASANTASFSVPRKFRYARVCRGGGGGARAQLAVDAVTARGGVHALAEGWVLGPGTTVADAYRSSEADDAYRPTAADPAGLVISSRRGTTKSVSQSFTGYLIRAGLDTYYDVSFQARGTGTAVLSLDGASLVTRPFAHRTWTAETFSFKAPSRPGKTLTLAFSTSDGATARVDSVAVQARLPYLTLDGMILHAIALFVREVYRHPPELAAFKSKADTYLQHLQARFARKYDADWVEFDGGRKGVYVMPGSSTEHRGGAGYPPGSSLPHNQYLAFGRFLAVLYEITGEPLYRERTTRMAETFKAFLAPMDGNTRYVWNYADRILASDPARSISVEDVSHGNIDVGFVADLYRIGLVFSSAHMGRFANAFLNKVWSQTALAAHEQVDGAGPLNTPRYQYFDEWISLGSVEPRIITAVADFVSGPNVRKTSDSYPLMLANLLYFAQGR